MQMDKINLPETLDVDPTSWRLPLTTPTPVVAAANPPEPTPEELIRLLHFPSHREVALSQLVKEVMSVYRQLPPSNRRITARESTRVCNAIALFQCMTAHPLTRMELIRDKITYYLHPFLGITATDDKPLEFLRLTSLGVIGALVKFDDLDGQHIVHYLLISSPSFVTIHRVQGCCSNYLSILQAAIALRNE